MPVTWLHISDLHVQSGDSYDRDVVFRALVKSVRRFRERDGRTPDLIFATGDIAYSGSSAEYAIASEFFDQILEASGLGRNRLYAVPGNHDVDRSVGLQLKRELGSRSEADDYFHPDTQKLHLTHKQGSFLRWYHDYFGGIRTMPEKSSCGPVELVRVRNQRLGVLPINTALFCQNDSDFERLCVGRRCLDTGIEELNLLGADLKIAVMHHPLHYLSVIERENIRASLVDHVDVVLSGHLHEAGYAGVDMLSGRNLYCAAGATYQTRKWPNTAYYATFHRDHVTIFPISYYDKPRERWEVDPSVFPDAPGYEASFPVPREPRFRSFRIPRWDGQNQIPARKHPDRTKTMPTGSPEPRLGRGVGSMEAMGEKPARKQKRVRGTKNKRKA